MPFPKYTLVVNTTAEERRVALLEGKIIKEIFLERRFERGLVGNIYKGRILRVLPGMDAAFVEIGYPRSGFLQRGSALIPRDAIPEGVETNEEENNVEVPLVPDAQYTHTSHSPLEVGQDILVQVIREGIGGKGPRLSTVLSLAGRNLIFLPNTPLVGVSRRIEDEEERARLKSIVIKQLPKNSGAILRTAAMYRPEEEILEDLEFLKTLWQRVVVYAQEREAPALVYGDLDILLRSARDLLTEGCEKMIVDTEEDFDRLLQFVDSFMPQLDHLVELYNGEDSIFEHFGIEDNLSFILARKVWLKSGGYIVIDHTEALTAIDVNTGGALEKGDPEEVILKTNIEAAKEIAYQLRLRNIGGIVVIDFVGMRDPEHRNQVYMALLEELANDKAFTEVHTIGNLSLMVLTRKHTRDNVFAMMTQKCPYCEGRGWVKSVESIASDIIRRVVKELKSPRVKGVRIFAHSRVVDSLIDSFRYSLADLETKWQKVIRFVRRDDMHLEAYTIRRE